MRWITSTFVSLSFRLSLERGSILFLCLPILIYSSRYRWVVLGLNTNLIDMKRFFRSLFLFVISSTGLIASHDWGGQIVARCVDNPSTSALEYEVELKIYRDGGFGIPGTVNMDLVSSSTSMSFTASVYGAVVSYDTHYGPMDIITYVAIVPLDVDDINTVSYSVCCRPAGVANIGNGSNSSLHGIYLYTEINTEVAPCSNTPEFVSQPIVSYPVTHTYEMHIEGFDAEGDSLYYRLGNLYEINKQMIPYGPASFGSISPDGWLHFESPFSGEVNSLAYDIEAYTNERVSALVHREMILTTVPNPNWQYKVIPSVSFYNPVHSWQIGVPDSVLIQVRAGAGLEVEMTAPSDLSRSKLKLTTEFTSSRDSVSAYVQYIPQASDVGMTYPVVVRFKSAEVLWDEVIYVKAHNGIGVIENQSKSSILVYPNPTRDEVKVDIANSAKRLEIIDNQGRVVQSSELSPDDVHWTGRAPRASGVYFIKLYFMDGGLEMEAFIVE